MKRQRGRNRGGGGGGGNMKPTQNANRAFDSNGPEGVKVRGNPQHVFEKYQQLARDANAAGDRVLGENYLQHAEHYFRLLRAIQPNRPASEILGRDHFSSGYDIDFEDETGQAQALAADEAATAAGEPAEDSEVRDQNRPRDRSEWQSREDRPRDERPREDRNRDDRPRDDRPRDDRPRNDGTGNRERFSRDNNRDRDRNRNRDDRPRDDRPREDRPRDDRPRDDRPRAEGDEVRREEPRRERYDRQDRGDRPERVEREPAPVVTVQAVEAPEPRGACLPAGSASASAQHRGGCRKARARSSAQAQDLRGRRRSRRVRDRRDLSPDGARHPGCG